MALMENYDYFKENVAIAEGSEGELTKQQKIFEESWEASSQRVKAAIEGVYQALLDDKFFIKLNDLIAGALGGVENFIEGIGGIGPIIAGVASIIVGSFANKIPDAIRTASYNLSILTKGSEAAYQKIQAQTKAASEYTFNHGIKEDSSAGVEVQNANELLAAKNKLAIVQDDLSNQENQQYQIQLATIQANQQELVVLKQKEESLREQVELQRQAMSEADVGSKATSKTSDYRKTMQADITDQLGGVFEISEWSIPADIQTGLFEDIDGFSHLLEKKLTETIGQAINSANKKIIDSINGDNPLKSFKLFSKGSIDSEFKPAIESIGDIGKEIEYQTKNSSAAMSIMRDEISQLESTIPPAIREATGLSKVFKELEDPKWGKNIEDGTERVDAFAKAINTELVAALEKARIKAKDFPQIGEKLNGKGFAALKGNIEALNKVQGEATEKASLLKKLYDDFTPKHIVATSEAIASMTSMLTSASLALNSFSTGFQSLFNTDLSGFERLSSFLVGMGNGAMQGINTLRQYATVAEFVSQKVQLLNVAKEGSVLANTFISASSQELVDNMSKEVLSEAAVLAMRKKATGATKEAAIQEVALILMKEKSIDKNAAKIISEELLTQAYDRQKVSIIGSIQAWAAETAASTSNVWIKRILIGLQSVLNGLTGKWILLISAGLVAVAALVKALNNQSNAQEKVIENIKKADEEYEKAKSQLDSLNTSLENVKKRIEELNAIENPTLLDKEELEKAQAEEASLTRQIALQERLVELAEEKKKNELQLFDVEGTAEELQKSYQKTFTDNVMMGYKINENDISAESFLVPSENQIIFHSSAELNQKYKEIEEAASNGRVKSSLSNAYAGLQIYAQSVSKLASKMEAWENDIAKGQGEVADLEAKISSGELTPEQQDAFRQINDLKNTPMKNVGTIYGVVITSDGKVETRGEMYGGQPTFENFYSNVYKPFMDNYQKYIDNGGEITQEIYDQMEEYTDIIITQGMTYYETELAILEEAFKDAPTYTEQITTVKNNLKKLSDKYDKGVSVEHAGPDWITSVQYLSNGQEISGNEIASAKELLTQANDIGKVIDFLEKEKLKYDPEKDQETIESIDGIIGQLKIQEETLRTEYKNYTEAIAKWTEENQEKILYALESIYSDLISNYSTMTVEKIEKARTNAAQYSEWLYGEDWIEKADKQLAEQLSSYLNYNFNSFLMDLWQDEDKFNVENILKYLPNSLLATINAAGRDPKDFIGSQMQIINDKFDTYAKALTPANGTIDQGKALLKELRESGKWSDAWLDDLQLLDITGEETANDIITKLKELHTEVEQLDFLGDLTDITKAISGLKIGDILSEEDYSLLVKYNSELEKYFMYTSSGYKYMGGADDELRKISLNDQIEGAQAYKDFYDKGTDFQNKISRSYDTNLFTDASYWTNTKEYGFLKGSLSNSLVDFIKQNTNDKELKNLDISTLFHGLTSDDVAVQEAARNLAVKFFQAFNEAMETGASYTDEKIQGLLFEASVKTWEDLQNFLAENNITDENQIANYQFALMENLSSEAGIDYDEVKDYAKNLREVNENLKDEVALSERIALAEKKQNKGIEDLTSNYEDYAKILKEASLKNELKNTEKYSNAITSLRKDLSLLTGVEKDVDKVFDDNFINSEEVQQTLLDISNGVDGATEKLKALAAMQEIRVNLNDDAAKLALDGLQEEIIALNQDDTIEIGATIDDSAALSSLLGLMEQAGFTAEQIQSCFDNLGWRPELGYEDIPVKDLSTHSTGGYVEVVTGDQFSGYKIERKHLSAFSQMDQDTLVRVPVLGKKLGGGFTKIDPPNKNFSSNKNSGGGGGGSSKHAEKKNNIDKERYHTVLNQLEDLKAEYDDISKAKDRAFGQDRVDFLDGEINKTDELIKKQKEYVEAIKAYLPVDKAIMDATYKDLIGGPEIKYDERGNISNFDEIQDAMFNKYNEMTERFTDDSEEWDVFEKQYEQLQKYIEQYEETYDLLRDQEQEYQDLINQRIDLQLEKVQYKVEVKLDISKDEVAVLEYQLGKVEDDAFKSLEAIGLLTAKANELYTQIQINKQGLNEALKLSLSAAEISELLAGNLSVLDNKNFTDDQISAIKDYRDSLLDLNGELDDVRENIEDKVLDAFDTWNEKLTTGSDILDHYGTILENFKNIVDIVGEDTLGISDEFMINLSQGTVDNAINKVRATKNIAESVVKAQEEAQKSLDEARARGDAQAQEMWENTLKSIDEQAREAQENFMQAWEDALSGLADQFEQTIDRVLNNFNKSVYAVGGLEGLGNDFQKQKDDSDLMLDDYQKIYELSKLSRDINKTIDDTDVVSGKQKLKKLLEQVNDLQADGVEMSQYDLEYLQKTYDLRLAELELEEAQRAKNTVRLQKDNEGNWSYIYTQSSDAIDSAQQKYEDALYAMQDLSSNYIDEMSEKLIDTSQEMADALAALRVQDFASLDDYYKEVQRVQDEYQERMAIQENELNKAIANNKDLYDQDWTNYHNATGYKISDTENFATAFKDTLLGILMDSDSDTANFTDILGQSVQDLTAGLLGAAETYYRNLEEAMNAAGTSTGGFAEDAKQGIDEIVSKSDEGAQAVEDMSNRMNDAMTGVIDTVKTWQQTYGEAMEKIIQSNMDVINSFNDMLAALGADANNISIKYDITRGDEGIQRFASGGYTGEWGASGKLAVLDEKEMVLNQNDTANMLDMLQITRDIISAIDTGATYASLGFGNLTAATIRDQGNNVLEQNVHITAEFPNATDHNEIEMALRSLQNTASQYANRK